MNRNYYAEMMQPAFAGMKADMGFDRVESHPAGGAIPFGVVVGVDAEGKVTAGKSTRAIGVALHSHAVTGDGYDAKDSVSVMTRGLVWAKAGESDASEAGHTVKFNAAGEVDSTASDTLANAMVRDVFVGQGGRIALIELHAPTA